MKGKMRLAVGDKVKIKRGCVRAGKECFVEAIINRGKMGKKKDLYQASLYEINGDYAGDYWEDEFERSGELITDDELMKLINENIGKKGLVKDFARVLYLKEARETK